MAQNRVDLANIFQTVTQTLIQNQQALNQADEYNHDHGMNMVQTFETITQALQEKQGRSDRTALAYAAKKLSKSSTSSSGQLYSQALAQAATQFKGRKVDDRGAMELLQTLISGGQPAQQGQPAAGGDLLGSLMGGLTGGTQSQPQQSTPPAGDDLLGSLIGEQMGAAPSQPQQDQQSAGGDLLGSLLGGLTGGAQSQPQQDQPSAGGDLLGSLLGGLAGGGSASSGASDGLDLGDLLNAGMSFLQAKESGGSTIQALIQAFVGASGMGRSAHRTQSTTLVVDSFLQALGSSGESR
jgi:hypothetical protein